MSFPPLFILVGEGRRSSQQIKFRFPRYHELEDLDKLSLAVFDERDNPKDWKETQLHRELCLNEQLGAELNPQFLKIDSERVMSLEGRLQTFPECWPRPLVLEMGLCGFYYKSEDTMCCFMCCVEFRWEHSDPPQCPWNIHKELAPNCRQLKRSLCDGPSPTPPGKRRRRCSVSAVDDLKSKPNTERH